jgi:hypothetical protein
MIAQGNVEKGLLKRVNYSKKRTIKKGDYRQREKN